jgi:glycosyltransferase involved in cell wall biosynthesis
MNDTLEAADGHLVSALEDVAPPVAVGHPYMPIGMGEHLRASVRSLRAVGLAPSIKDVFDAGTPDPAQKAEFGPALGDCFGAVNIFHINGDEVDRAFAAIGEAADLSRRNIIYPMWELSRYPEPWARALERFDEVWAPSLFVRDALAASVARPIVHMPVSVEVRLNSFIGRRCFGIPEHAYAFLFFFDFRSYAARKNPSALLDCFRRLQALRPWAPVVLVVKTHGEEAAPADAAALRAALAAAGPEVVFISGTLADNDVKNLVRMCDCFVSLHRSEGFGLGIAEAMALGRPTIATAYSGNMDFCANDTNLLVDYTLVGVPDGAYPFAEGQVWAEPDTEQATNHMLRLLDDPGAGRALGRRAARLRMLDRLAAIAAS